MVEGECDVAAKSARREPQNLFEWEEQFALYGNALLERGMALPSTLEIYRSFVKERAMGGPPWPPIYEADRKQSWRWTTEAAQGGQLADRADKFIRDTHKPF